MRIRDIDVCHWNGYHTGLPEGETVPGSNTRKRKQPRLDELQISNDAQDESPTPPKQRKVSRKQERSNVCVGLSSLVEDVTVTVESVSE